MGFLGEWGSGEWGDGEVGETTSYALRGEVGKWGEKADGFSLSQN